MPERVCPCGELLKTRHQDKFCSKVCFYKYRKKKQKGCKYTVRVQNKGWLKKGHKTWNKGVPSKQRKENPGGDAIHEWVERWAGKHRKCEHCGTETAKMYQWSSKSHEHKRDLTDWQRLCVKCHHKYDNEKFGLRKVFYRK